MRTAMETISQEEMDDDRPIALRRKRRASTAIDSPQKPQHSERHVNSQNVFKTPTKPKKRVRFSDPGPNLLSSPSSTGITPFIKRTTLAAVSRSGSPTPKRLLERAPKRRTSMPQLLDGAIPGSIGNVPISPPPPTFEFQFAPLRQILGDRAKRRIRRNNLSSEINEIEAEVRTTSGNLRQQVQQLKEELAQARESNRGMQMAEQDAENGNRIHELEVEIGRLKEEMRGRSMTAESCTMLVPYATTANGNDDVMLINDENDNHGNELEDSNFVMSAGDSFPTPAASSIVESPAQSGFIEMMQCESSAQTTLESAEIAALETQLADSKKAIQKARLSLEHLFPGESTLPLTPTSADPTLLIDSLFNHISGLKQRIQAANKAFDTSRTQESNLRAQFNTTLHHLATVRAEVDSLRRAGSTVISAKDAMELELKTQIKTLESDVDEKDRSITKLNAAMNSYMAEMRSLESLIIQLEAEHAAKLVALHTAHDEAVADLECIVAAETRGRREAEDTAESALLSVKRLEGLQTELKATIAEKQGLVRELEEEIETLKAGMQHWETEVGCRNVRVSELSMALDEAKGQLSEKKAECQNLAQRVEEERSAGLKAVEAVRCEIEHHSGKMGHVVEGYMDGVKSRGQGSEVEAIKGLLTPTEAKRFRDVCSESLTGVIQIGRGRGKKTMSKRGIDSGIAILEEDEDEDEYADGFERATAMDL